MRMLSGIFLSCLTLISLVNYASGVNCWICQQARSNRDCLIRGHARTCRSNEGCENEVRYTGYMISVTKRCKQLQACSNDQFQNSQISNKRYQCGAGRQNSVCRCCCKSDDCNRNQLSCLEQGQPKCRFLFLPNGSTKCFGSADGISLRTRCRFSCRAGYERKGAYSVTCQQRGSMAEWSSAIPKCRKRPTCSRIYSHSISNGFVRCTGTYGIATLGTSCVFRCNPRYFMMNANKRKTFSNYERTVCTLAKDIPTWSRKPPNCIEEMCPLVTNFDHGVVKCTEYNKLGSVCQFACFTGYDMDGESTITCVQKSGVKNWNFRPPICRPKPCPINTFNKPLLSAECTDFNRYGSVCSVTCKKGFYMSDPRTNTPINAYTPTCVLRGEGVAWSKTPPKCSPKKCPRIRVPKSAVMKCTGGTQYLSRCTFACPSPIHEIVGRKTLVCSDDGSPGNRDGVWSSPIPTCELKKCSAIDDSATNVKCNKGYVYKSTCTFSCKEGYFMLASDGLTITRSKAATKTTCSLVENQVVWSRDPPKCAMKRCHEIMKMDNGKMICSDANKIGSKCSFSCFDGFEMAGKPNLECREARKTRILGKWSAPPPICKRRSCANIYHDKVSSVLTCTEDFKYESSCTLRCHEGFYMRKSPTSAALGRIKTTCLYSSEGMTWSSRTPSCQPKTCDSFKELLNGTMRCSEELIYSARCDFSCSRGFTLMGPQSVVCEDDTNAPTKGKWNLPAPTCEPRNCEQFLIDSQEMRADCSKGRGYTSECHLICKPRHFMRLPGGEQTTRSMKMSCDLNEDDSMKWRPDPQRCEPVSCPAIELPVVYSSCSNGNNTGSKCTFSCPVGYDLVGNVTNKCLELGQNDAKWRHPLPHCKIRTCLDLVSEEDVNKTCTENSDYNSVCSFFCQNGLGLFMTEAQGNKIVKSGVSILRCDIDSRGKMFWTGNLPKCHIKYCLVMRNPKNGKVKCSNGSKYKSECRYTCNRGYRRLGSQIVTCEEGKLHSPQGKWSGKPAMCRKR